MAWNRNVRSGAISRATLGDANAITALPTPATMTSMKALSVSTRYSMPHGAAQSPSA